MTFEFFQYKTCLFFNAKDFIFNLFIFVKCECWQISNETVENQEII